MICRVCDQEITENGTKKLNIDVHEGCKDFVVYYENKSDMDYVRCHGNVIDLVPSFINGWLKGVGKCPKCGKLYVTDRFPDNPKPRKLKLPDPPSAEKRSSNAIQ